mmetsp:Transcript_4509/g.14982  ORF Transcript_4509/g.14982 Transcript_4509/m.14982 type:complete len:453 (-) Transcript_4509:47-1405(-)
MRPAPEPRVAQGQAPAARPGRWARSYAGGAPQPAPAAARPKARGAARARGPGREQPSAPADAGAAAVRALSQSAAAGTSALRAPRPWRRSTPPRSVGHGVRARADLEELLRDCGLPCAVHRRGEGLAQLGRVVRGRLHGAHARRELGRHRLLHSAEELAVDVEREDGVEQLRGLLLEDHVRRELLRLGARQLLAVHAKLAPLGGQLEDLVALRLEALGREGHEGAHRGHRGDHGHEGGVQELHAVHLPGEEVVEDVVTDVRSKLRGGRLRARHERRNVVHAAAEPGVRLAADAEELHGDPLLLELREARRGLLDDLRVVPAAEAALARDDNEEHRLGLALLEERELKGLALEAGDEAAEHLLQVLREGPGPEHGVLRAAHLGGGHELHRLRDLLGVLDGTDAVPELADVGTHGHGGPRAGHAVRRRAGGRHGAEGRGRGDKGQGDEAAEHPA